MPVSKRVRFEVFKRDKFTCQYCGKKAPDVVLHLDHIKPKAKGGKGDILNLVTSCSTCNLGKGARELSDDSALEKQRRQMEELQERREQLEMMIQWQRTLGNLEADVIAQLESYWCDLVGWRGVTEEGLHNLKRWYKAFGVEEVMAAMRTAVEKYLQYDDDGKVTEESSETAFAKVGGICRITRVEKDKPYIKDLYYIRGILRNRITVYRAWEVMQRLEYAYELGATIEMLRNIALDATSWTNWSDVMFELADELETRQQGGDGETADT